MATLKEISQDILDEKTLKIIPENIRKGVTVFDVVGTYEGQPGPGPEPTRRIKLFETTSAMEEDTDPQEDDLALIYSNSSGNAEAGMTIGQATFPEQVVLPEPISDSEYWYASEGDYDITCNLYPYSFSFEIMNYSEYENRLRVEYMTIDRQTYDLYSMTQGSDPITNPVTFPVSFTLPNNFTSNQSLFFLVGVLNYDGLYEYKNGSWSRATTQLNVDNTKLFANYKVYDGSNYISNGRLGVMSNVYLNELMEMTNLVNAVFTPWELDSSITNLSNLYTGNMVYLSDFPKMNLSNITDITHMFGENFYGFQYESSFINFAESVPNASQLVSPLLLDTGLSPTTVPQSALNILANKGYLDTITPDTTNWSTQYRFTVNGTQNIVNKNYNASAGEYDRYGVTINSYVADKCNNANIIIEDLGSEGSLLYTMNLFWYHSTYIRSINLTGLKTENVLSMKELFSTCRNVTTITNFNTSNVRDMSYMFNGCNNLTAVPSLDTSNATNMSHTYDGCTKITSISGINTSKALNMSHTFNNCQNLSTISGDVNTSLATDLSNLFQNCLNLTECPANIDTSNATNVSNIFYNCTKFNSIPNLNLGKCKDVSGLLSRCSNITSIPNFNISGVTKAYSMLSGCSNITSIPNLDVRNIVNGVSMFSSMKNITTIDNLNFDNLTDGRWMFQWCDKLSSVNILTPNLENMMSTFANCPSLTSIPNINTEKVTYFRSCFYGANNLRDLSSATIVTNNAESVEYMFQVCVNLTDAPMLNTEKVKGMLGMFQGCTNLVNVPQYNTANVTAMESMFYSCNKLSDASIQNIVNMMLNSNVTNSKYMNLVVSNEYSVFGNSNITNARYSNRISELTAKGWTC